MSKPRELRTATPEEKSEASRILDFLALSPNHGRSSVTTRVLQEIMMSTGGDMLAMGYSWDVCSRRLAPGVHKVWLVPARRPSRRRAVAGAGEGEEVMLTAAQPAVEEVTRLHAECSRLRAELEAAKKREEALDDELHALSLRVLEPLAPALDSLADLKFDPAALEKANAEIATLRARIEAGVAAATPVAALAAAEAQPADARKVVDEQAEALARKDALLDLFAGEDTTLQTAAELEVGKRMMDEKQIAKMEQNAASLAMVHP